MNPLVIIPCGGKKAATPQPAAQLYQGGYFKACLEYALRQTTPDQVRILSGKYGLLTLDQVIAPYEMRLGQLGCVTATQVAAQAAAQGLQGRTDVIVAAGKDYASLAKTVWPSANWVLEGKGGMGYQIQFMKRA